MRFDVEVSICIFAMKPMPRKGTETGQERHFEISLLMKPMPRKGTETAYPAFALRLIMLDETHAP